MNDYAIANNSVCCVSAIMPFSYCPFFLFCCDFDLQSERLLGYPDTSGMFCTDSQHTSHSPLWFRLWVNICSLKKPWKARSLFSPMAERSLSLSCGACNTNRRFLTWLNASGEVETLQCRKSHLRVFQIQKTQRSSFVQMTYWSKLPQETSHERFIIFPILFSKCINCWILLAPLVDWAPGSDSV